MFLSKSEIKEEIDKYCLDSNTSFLGKKVEAYDIDKCIKDLVKNDKIINDEDKVSLTVNYAFENNSAKLLAQIMTEKSDLLFLNREGITKHIADFEKETGFQLSEEQERCFILFCRT